MPDLNDLLRWSIANSTPKIEAPNDQQLSLRFNPTPTSTSGSSTLHPSDPHYHDSTDDASDVSTSGPATPVTGTSSLAGIAKRSDLNSEILDLIMGKSDSLVMKEKMATAMDESLDVDQRVEALDDFEMLIEMLDNANNMAVLKLWDPLLSLLKSEHSAIVTHACWIIGTAVQNNLKAQSALYVHNALSLVLSIIYPSPSATTPGPSSITRARATYAFSSALKHWPLTSTALLANSSQGYAALRRGVADPDLVVRRKMAFLVGTLIRQSEEKYEGEIPNEVRNLIEERTKAGGESETLLDGSRREGIFAALVEALKNGDGEDLEFEENALRALGKAAEKGGLSEGEKAEVRAVWEKLGPTGQDERGLGGEDRKELSRAFV